MTIIRAPLEDRTLWKRGTVATPTAFFEIYADSLGIVRVDMVPNAKGRCSRGEGFAAEAVDAIESYLAGRYLPEDLPIHLPDSMTKFSFETLKTCAAIPRGQTLTYGELARKINRPQAARAVGRALGANPVPLFIPCHRVVSVRGLGGYTGGLAIKRFFLNVEGVSNV